MHPYAKCAGIPVNMYAGREMVPPPPAAASTNPASPTIKHTKTKDGREITKELSTIISLLLFFKDLISAYPVMFIICDINKKPA